MTSLTLWLWTHSRACPTVPLLLTLQQVPQAGKEAPTFPTQAMGKHVALLWLSGSFFRGISFLLLCWECWHPAFCHCLGHQLITWCTHTTLKVGPYIGQFIHMWPSLLILILYWTTSFLCSSASTAHTEVLDRNSAPAELKKNKPRFHNAAVVSTKFKWTKTSCLSFYSDLGIKLSFLLIMLFQYKLVRQVVLNLALFMFIPLAQIIEQKRKTETHIKKWTINILVSNSSLFEP